MLRLTHLIAVLCCLCQLALCSEDGSGWTPLLTAVAQRRYGSNGNVHNVVGAKSPSGGFQPSNDNSFVTTAKYQYGDSGSKPDGPILTDGVSVNTYKAVPGYGSSGTSNLQNQQGHNSYLGNLENKQQRLNYGMHQNINGFNSGVINNNQNVGYNTVANIKNYGSNSPGNVINGLNNHFGGTSLSYGDMGNYKVGNGHDAFTVTSYRGTSGTGEVKGSDVRKSLVENYASRRPISYDQILGSKIFDQNRNPNYNINDGSNFRNVEYSGMTYPPNNNNHNNLHPLPPNDSNKNNMGNTGYMKGVVYANIDDVKDNNNVLTEHTMGNTGPTSQNNNYNWNNNNNNNGYRQGSSNGNMNEHPHGAQNNGVKISYSVDDNYIDGPPPRKQFYQQESMQPAVNPPFSATKSQSPPSLQQYNPTSPDLKSYQPNSRPPMASEGYPPSSRPPLQEIIPPPPMVTSNYGPLPPQQLPMKSMQPQQQQQIAPHQQIMGHPAPNLQPHQPRPDNQYQNHENLQDPNSINDSFLQRLIQIISNTLYYGDLESRRHSENL